MLNVKRSKVDHVSDRESQALLTRFIENERSPSAHCRKSIGEAATRPIVRDAPPRSHRQPLAPRCSGGALLWFLSVTSRVVVPDYLSAVANDKFDGVCRKNRRNLGILK